MDGLINRVNVLMNIVCAYVQLNNRQIKLCMVFCADEHFSVVLQASYVSLQPRPCLAKTLLLKFNVVPYPYCCNDETSPEEGAQSPFSMFHSAQ